MSTTMMVYAEAKHDDKWLNINNRNRFDGFEEISLKDPDSIEPTYVAGYAPSDAFKSLGKGVETHQSPRQLSKDTARAYQKLSDEVTGEKDGLVCFSMKMVDFFKALLYQDGEKVPLNLLDNFKRSIAESLISQNWRQLRLPMFSPQEAFKDMQQRPEAYRYLQNLRLVFVFDCSYDENGKF